MEKDYVFSTRNKLPAKCSKHEYNVWKLLRGSLSEDLSRVSMPVHVNEPISFLQKMTEYLKYADLLIKAANCQNELECFEHIVAFAVSATSTNYQRHHKPFNPLLGETYELQSNGFTFVAEQVSHHPPISVFHAKHKSYILSGSISPNIKLTTSSFRIFPTGYIRLDLQMNNGEVRRYSWNLVKCFIRNYIVGQLWIELSGPMEIKSDNLRAELNYHATTDRVFTDSNESRYGCLTGCIYSNNVPQKAVIGSWVTELATVSLDEYQRVAHSLNLPKIVHPEGKKLRQKPSLSLKTFAMSFDSPSNMRKSDANQGCVESELLPELKVKYPDMKTFKVLWSTDEYKLRNADFYNFTEFTMALNDLPVVAKGSRADIRNILPPTDSRFRPDMRYFEEGNIDKAETMKHKIEENQRNFLKENKFPMKALWFEEIKNPDGSSEWKFKEEYFKRDWSKCRNIFMRSNNQE